MSKSSSIKAEDYKYIFEEILDMSDDGFLLVDFDGMVVNINHSYACFLGKPRKDLIGKHVTEIIVNTEMTDIIKYDRRDKNFVTVIDQGEINSQSKFKISTLTRSAIKNDTGKIIGAVAQVKFRKQAINNANELEAYYKILNVYDKELINKIVEEHSIAKEIDQVKRLNLTLSYYKDEVRNFQENRLSYIVGTAPNFLHAKTAALKAAKNSFSVLITGETGTGKEEIANLIHWASNRAYNPFIKINCAAIPSELFESELFGYEKGAFTGAMQSGKKGKFELANNGSIFLDEIGDLPFNMQTKLLRVLQDGVIEPLGSIKPVSVNVRIISATNMALEELIEQGKFRKDLYYRLNELRVTLPKLSDRKIDIMPIAQHVLDKLNWEYETEVYFSDEVSKYFVNYSWPGNIRELYNVVKSAYANVDNNIIELSHLPESIVLTPINHLSEIKSLEEYLDMCEKNFIVRLLKKNGGNCKKTAEDLGIHRSNLYKKIDKYKIANKN
jgi:PAS domain S-box